MSRDLTDMDGREARRTFLAQRVDPRALAGYVVAVAAVALFVDHPALLVVLAAAVWLVVVSAVPERSYRPYLIYSLLAGLGAVVLNPLVSRSGLTILATTPPLPLLGAVSVSAEAIAYGVAMALRLLAVTGAFTLYACLIDTDALFRFIAPSAPGAAVVLALSVRLFPMMARDAARISEAQRCRGQRLDSGSWLARTRAAVPVLDALTMSSLERAFDTAEALESRGFGRSGRTRLPGTGLAPRDGLLLATAGIVLAAAVGAMFGPAAFTYYPTLGDPAAPAALAVAGLLGLLVLFPTAMAWGWTQWHWLRSRI